jgi:hypothetical protein
MNLSPCGFGSGDTILANGESASDPNGDLIFLESGGSTRKLWVWHGVLMAVSWSILVPLAIGSSLLRDTLKLPPGVWLTMHFSLNMFAILCMVVSFGIAVYATNKKTAAGEDPKHFTDLKHGTIGLVIFLLAFTQAIIGMMRPHGPKKPTAPVDGPNDAEGVAEKAAEMAMTSSEALKKTQHSNDSSDDEGSKSGSRVPEKSIARRIWEYKHRITGLSLLGLSWYNCDAGLELLVERYGADRDLSHVFWGVTIGLSGLICILYAVQIARR